MLLIDWRLAKTALKLTNNYSDRFKFSPDDCTLQLMQDYHTIVKSLPVPIKPFDVPAAIDRLIDSGYFCISARMLGDRFYSITPKLNHRYAFWLDAFTKNFLGGFITGVLVTIVGAFVKTLLGI